MLNWELRKILFKNKIVYFIISAIFINLFFCFIQDTSPSPNVSNDVYMSYINQYKGELTNSKEASIESEYDKVMNSSKYIQQLQDEFQKGKINEQQLQKKSETYVKKKTNITSFRFFYNQYLNAKKDKEHHYILNTHGWDLLFNDSKTPILLLLLAICICVPNFSKEYEKEMDQLHLCCENGRTKLFLVKILAAVMVLVLTAFIMSCLDFFVAFSKFDLSGFLYPLQSIMVFNSSKFTVNLLSAYMLCTLIKFLALIFICIFSSVISILFKNQIVASITILLTNMFPFLSVMGTTAFILLPIPGDLLFSTQYLKGDQYQDVIISNNFVSKNVFSGFTESKLILFCIVVFIIIGFLLFIARHFYLQKKFSYNYVRVYC